MKHNIISAILTKNEDWIIDKTLYALNNFSNKIIVYDDRSTDKTEEIARSYDKVEWYVRPAHNPLSIFEAKQRLELIEIIKPHNPDYVVLLDADEIPTPSIMGFLNNIDETKTAWSVRMINLWADENHYRCDSGKSEDGKFVNFDPFGNPSWRKHPFIKFNSKFPYTYNMAVQRGGTSPFHPAPKNLIGDKVKTEDWYVIHYGKISPTWICGEKNKFYAQVESFRGNGTVKGTFEQRMRWHKDAIAENNIKLKPIDPNWVWK